MQDKGQEMDFTHRKNALPELLHFSTSKLGVSDKAVACGRSSHLPVDKFQMKFCQKVKYFAMAVAIKWFLINNLGRQAPSTKQHA